MRKLASLVAVGLLVATTASAEIVDVEVTGQVVFNAIGDAPLDTVRGGDTVVVSFQVDSENFTEGVPDDTRGYSIDQSSFTMSFSSGAVVGLAEGGTPFFTLVDGFPVSDGFFVSSSPVSPGGVPLDVADHNLNVDLGYVGETLTSLDITDAYGVYEFDGLTRFGFTIWRIFPDNAGMEIDFSSLTIAGQPVPVEAASWGEIKATFGK